MWSVVGAGGECGGVAVSVLEQKWERTPVFLRNKKSEEQDQDCGGGWCVVCVWSRG